VGDCIDLNVSGADFYSWEPAPGITDTTLQTQNVCPAVTTTYTVHGYTIGGSAMTNGDFEGGATGFNSDYTLNSNTQTEGTYFVTTNANLTHPGFTGLDHTTGSGNFLVVNGSSTPNSSVWCQTVAVQPNTNYVFSTWVSTLAIGSPAVLQFSINGINISDPFTAPSVTGVWDEFYTTWNSGSQTTATICIVNQNTSLGGNDFGIDDIFFSAVCPTTETVTITVNEPANATITPVGPFCISGSAVTLQVAQTGGSWSGNGVNASTGSFNPAIAGAGTHNITYTIGGPCGDSDMIQIVVNPLPLADVGVDQEVCAGDAVTLTATGGTSYTWSNGVTNGVPFVPVATTVYTVTVTDANGCEETDNVTVTVNPLPTINGGPDVTVCEGTQVTLNGSGGASYLWNNGGTDGQPFTPNVGTTVFTVTGTDANGCVNIDNVNVTALPMPVADIEADINSGFPVLTVNFTNNSANANSYSWNFDNGQLNTVTSTSPQTTSYSEPGTYVVYMIADNGVCQVTDTVHIIVIPFPDPWIHIPNVFTPNGDGANDEFTIQTSYVAEMEIQIYNRWGEFMDEIIGTADFWNGQFNGKDVSDGTYFFKYYVKGINGKELSGHGNVTLIR
jgi:gliding motility-associated-like protein